MSTKTLRKRIALVAVSAMGAGVLSVTPANATSTATAVDGKVSIAGTSTLCYASNDAGTAVTLPTVNTAVISSADAGLNVVMPVGGSLRLSIHAADNTFITGPLSVTSFDVDGTATGGGAEATNAVQLNAAGELYIDNGSADNDVILQALAVGSATLVAMASGTTRTPTRGNTINLTIVSACTTAVVSEADTVSQATTLTAIAAGAVTRGADILTIAAGEPVSITAVVKNAYAVAVPSDTFTVTATNGAKVNIDGSAISLTTPDTKGSTSFDSATADGTDVFVRVDNPTGAALSTTVTISYAGQAVATKNLTWRGEATKINVIGKTVGKTSGKGQIHYTLTDAAGNLTAGTVSGLVTSFGAQVTSTSDTTNTGTTTQPTWATTGKGASFSSTAPVTENINSVAITSVIPSATYGIAIFNCGSTSGSAEITLRHYQPVTGAYITTPVTVSCAGGVDTYTVSADKASYNVGEVATFTITAKDSKGNAVHDYLSTNNAALLSGTAADVSVGGGTLTKATATSDAIGVLAGLASGTAVYKAQVTTAGSFNAVINLAGSTTKSQTVGYKVTSSDASNADVLKAIVSLIASINKQIAALQKALLRR
jgi:hypothetical protein